MFVLDVEAQITLKVKYLNTFYHPVVFFLQGMIEANLIKIVSIKSECRRSEILRGHGYGSDMLDFYKKNYS